MAYSDSIADAFAGALVVAGAAAAATEALFERRAGDVDDDDEVAAAALERAWGVFSRRYDLVFSSGVKGVEL